MSDSAILWTSVHQASLSFIISQSLLKLMSIESVMPSYPLLPPSLALNFSQHQVFSNESSFLIRWLKYRSFSFSISSSSEHSGLISFRMDWIDLLAVQWTLKSLLRHQSSKASIIWHPAFFKVQISVIFLHEQPLWSHSLIYIQSPECIYCLLSCFAFLLEYLLFIQQDRINLLHVYDQPHFSPHISIFLLILVSLLSFRVRPLWFIGQKKDISKESINEDIRGVRKFYGVDKRFRWIASI